MTKSERKERFNDYLTRGDRALADLMVQADEHIEKQDAKLAKLRGALNALLEATGQIGLLDNGVEDARTAARAALRVARPFA